MDSKYADPGAMLATTHDLGDGLRVRIRLTRPTDGPRVRAFLERLSPESRRLRFLVPMPSVSDAAVGHFLFYDPRERLVLAATAPVEGTEQIVGMADLALLETGLAEIGLVVDENQRGHGLGKLLSEAVASLAIRQGVSHLKAEVLDDNDAMAGLMERLGSTARTVEEGNAIVYAKLSPRAALRAA